MLDSFVHFVSSQLPISIKVLFVLQQSIFPHFFCQGIRHSSTLDAIDMLDNYIMVVIVSPSARHSKCKLFKLVQEEKE
jgi:hypothetical protein